MNEPLFTFSGFLKFGQLEAPFWDPKFFKHIETTLFLGTMFIDVIMKKKVFCHWRHKNVA